MIQSIAMEYMGMERHSEAADMFARYLQVPGEPPDRRAQAARHMCVMLMLQNKPQEARIAALQALSEFWLWPDTHLTLAEAEQTLGRPDQALVHARTAMELGKPNTLLIINPTQYTAHPKAIMAICLAQMGRFEEAVQMAEECLAIAPSYPLAVQHLPLMQAQLRKNRAVDSFLAASSVLVEAGEPLKARALLDQAPWYVFEDSRLVKRRGELWSMIGDRKRAPALITDPDADAFLRRQRAA